jgi:hypothetical protein
LDEYRVGDHVQIFLKEKHGQSEGWFDGIIVRIEPYSDHRSFHWVELDEVAQALLGVKQISVFNPKNIRKI